MLEVVEVVEVEVVVEDEVEGEDLMFWATMVVGYRPVVIWKVSAATSYLLGKAPLEQVATGTSGR
jgi:hypothetical protein